MKIKLEENAGQKEIEVYIRYDRMSPTVKKIETLVRSVEKTVRCRQESEEVWLNASDIFYIESVDKRTYIYGEHNVYQSELRLYQLEESLLSVGFVRVSKACILNINELVGIRPLLNSRMEATMSNGEKINVTRKFIPLIREKLEAHYEE